MTPNLSAQFQSRHIDLPPQEAEVADEAVARWNGFVEGRRRGIEVAQEHNDAHEAATRPGVVMTSFGIGGLLNQAFPEAGWIGGVILCIVGACWFAVGHLRLYRRRSGT